SAANLRLLRTLLTLVCHLFRVVSDRFVTLNFPGCFELSPRQTHTIKPRMTSVSFTKDNSRGVENEFLLTCAAVRKNPSTHGCGFLLPALGYTSPVRSTPRPVATAGMHASLGRQLDRGLFRSIRLAWPRR